MLVAPHMAYRYFFCLHNLFWFFHFINVYITYEINKVDRPKSEEVELFFRLIANSEFEFLIHVDINLLSVFLILTDHPVNSS